MEKEVFVMINGKEVFNVYISIDEDVIIESLDKTIVKISEKIQNDNTVLQGDYADTVKSLAALVEARAKLI